MYVCEYGRIDIFLYSVVFLCSADTLITTGTLYVAAFGLCKGENVLMY